MSTTDLSPRRRRAPSSQQCVHCSTVSHGADRPAWGHEQRDSPWHAVLASRGTPWRGTGLSVAMAGGTDSCASATALKIVKDVKQWSVGETIHLI